MFSIQTVVVSGLLVLISTVAGYVTQHFLQRHREFNIRTLEVRSKVYGNLSGKISVLINEVQEHHAYWVLDSSDKSTGELGVVRIKTNADLQEMQLRKGGTTHRWRSLCETYEKRMKLVQDIQICIGEAMLYAKTDLQNKLLVLEDLLYSPEFQINHNDENEDKIHDFPKVHFTLRELWVEILDLMKKELNLGKK